MEGRLRLAEKERARRQARIAGPGGTTASAPSGPSSKELEQLEAQANANMAALLLEEASTKVCLHCVPGTAMQLVHQILASAMRVVGVRGIMAHYFNQPSG